MLNILSILEFIALDVKRNPQRFHIADAEHIIDSKTGVNLHMYDDYFKATYNGEVVATMSDFTSSEQQAIWKIKQAITDPTIAEEKSRNYREEQRKRREHLANLFEEPTPVLDTTPSTEENTIEYSG